MLLAYLYFYNPLRFLLAITHPESRLYLADALMQVLGMWGLTRNVRRTFGWLVRLWRGNIQRTTTAPASPLQVVHVKPAVGETPPASPAPAKHSV